MEVGDLIVIIEDLPNWDWLDYRTGDIGIVMKIRPEYLNFTIVEVRLIRTGEKHPIPKHFIKKLKETE